MPEKCRIFNLAVLVHVYATANKDPKAVKKAIPSLYPSWLFHDYTSVAAREMSHLAIRFGTTYHVLPHRRVSLATKWRPGSMKSL